MLLAFVLTLLDRPATVLFVVLRPVEVDVDSEYSWPPFTASVLDALTAPGATLVNVTADVAPVPPSVTFVCVESSYWTASATPDETALDSDATLAFVVLNPVDSDATPLTAVLMLDEKPLTVVDSEPTVLVVVLTLLDSAVTVLFVVLKPVEVDVDSEYSWLPFTASVLDALTAPGATLVNVTADVAPVPPSVTFVCVESSY
jgi:hypothetical protein